MGIWGGTFQPENSQGKDAETEPFRCFNRTTEPMCWGGKVKRKVVQRHNNGLDYTEHEYVRTLLLGMK